MVSLPIMRKIGFKNIGYDPQIDYVKGLCIIFVIWTHALNRKELGLILFPYWGDTAVPIFLIIQAFHYYKKGIDIRMPSLLMLWKRIMQPFIIMIALTFLVQFFLYYDITDGNFSPSFYWNKRGAGSYYIFMYLEFALLIPLFVPLFKKLSVKWALLFFIILSQLLEFISCITHCPDNIYRILFFRYTFLIFIGYLLATKRIVINKVTMCWGLIGIISLYIFNYTNIDMEPLFYTSLLNWKYCHWICYLYIAYIFLWFLKYTYSLFNNNIIMLKYLIIIGKNSYEIYIFQIFYYATLYRPVNNTLFFVDEYYPVKRILYLVLSTIICIVPVIILRNKNKNKSEKPSI